MKTLVYIIGLCCAVLYVNGPPNTPTFPRMLMGFLSTKEQLSPTLCSNHTAVDQVLLQVNIVSVLTPGNLHSLQYIFRDAGNNDMTKCMGLVLEGNEKYKVSYTVQLQNREITAKVNWLPGRA